MTLMLEDRATENTVQPAILKHRWRGHGKDVCVVIRDGQISFIATDILAALDEPFDIFEHQPGPDAPLQERVLNCTTWSLATVRDTVEPIAAFNSDAAELLDFLEQIIGDYERYSARELGRTAIPHLESPRTIGGDVPTDQGNVSTPAREWYSVADAAAILCRDPALNLTQPALFDWLKQSRWIERPGTTWRPIHEMTVVDYLRVVNVKVRGVQAPYPQVCITPWGLQEIHHRIGGTAPIDLTAIEATKD